METNGKFSDRRCKRKRRRKRFSVSTSSPSSLQLPPSSTIQNRYIRDAHGIIFIVDASNPSRFAEARAVLERLVSSPDAAGPPYSSSQTKKTPAARRRRRTSLRRWAPSRREGCPGGARESQGDLGLRRRDGDRMGAVACWRGIFRRRRRIAAGGDSSGNGEQQQRARRGDDDDDDSFGAAAAAKQQRILPAPTARQEPH